MNKVNVAILGTGTIANKLAKAFLITEHANLYAVASRSIDKAAAFAAKHNIPNCYGSYMDALNDPEIDLIYIALPHSLHYTWAREALLHNKNVLCEKPMCVNTNQATDLFNLAAEKKLFFMEAMWTRFLPAVNIVKDLIDSGEIGEIKKIKGIIAHNSTRIRRMTDPALAGGMLLDCGIYLITSVFMLMGSGFTSLRTKATLSKEGVDLHSITTLYYPNGKLARFFMAMDIPLGNSLKIIGDKGTIKLKVVYNWQDIILKNKNGKQKINIPPQKAGGFEYMTEAVCRAILQCKGTCKELTPFDTLAVMRLMDTLRKQWKLKYPFEI